MKIFSIEILNLNSTGLMLGSVTPKGNIGVVLDDFSFDVYERIGCAIYSTCNGLVRIYQHAPGTKDGFGGSKIQLRIKEPSVIFPKIQATRLHTFCGDLWDGSGADKIVSEHLNTDLFGIAVKRVKDRNSCYMSVKATSKFMSTIGKAIVLGAPSQGDFSAELSEATQ